MFFFPTKCFPRFFDLKKMWAARTCRRTWRAWGCMQHECLCSRLRVHVVSTQSCVNSWPSCLLQCRTYPFSLETAVNLLKQVAGEALLSGNLAGVLVRKRKLICLHVFLFLYICVRQTPNRSLVTREYELPCAPEVHSYEDYISPFFAVKYVTIEAALVNYIVPDPLQPSMHAHDLAFMRFRASKWPLMHQAHM